MTDVSCALIVGKTGKILVTQRGPAMRLPLKWEFPGGKVEIGETAADCVIREIGEELNLKVNITGTFTSYVHGEGDQAIRLIPFLCEITEGEIKLAEHAAFQWLFPKELLALDWAEADLPIVNDYLNSWLKSEEKGG